MAIQFDGDNLIATLESGVTFLDAKKIYSDWKRWQLEKGAGGRSNRGYPAMFRTDGGNPLTSIIDQGSYFFLNNVAGWKIKPPEEDITIFLTGNLAVEDVNVPSLIPTIGSFSTAILGLQPVTQGVTPAMGQQVKFSSFQGGIAIDPVNGTDSIGDDQFGNPFGIRQLPVKTMANVLSIASQRGLRKVFVMNDLNISSVDISAFKFTFIGDAPSIQLNVDASANVTGSAMQLLTVIGELDGLNVLRDCTIGNITNVSGFIENCAFFGTVTLNGDTAMFGCYDQSPGDAFPIFSSSIYNLTVSKWHGDIGISAMTAGVATIEIYGGKLNLDVLCTGGIVFSRGEPIGPVVPNGATCAFVDQTVGGSTKTIANLARDIVLRTQVSTGTGDNQQYAPDAP